MGWNIPYEFSAGDLDCALLTLRMFLDRGAAAGVVSGEGVGDTGSSGSVGHAAPVSLDIPWDALTYVTGQVRGCVDTHTHTRTHMRTHISATSTQPVTLGCIRERVMIRGWHGQLHVVCVCVTICSIVCAVCVLCSHRRSTTEVV